MPEKQCEIILMSLLYEHIIKICVFVLASKAKSDKTGQDMEHLDFKIVVEPKDSQSFTVILVASSRQEKSAWTSDISQARQHASHSPAVRRKAEDVGMHVREHFL